MSGLSGFLMFYQNIISIQSDENEIVEISQKIIVIIEKCINLINKDFINKYKTFADGYSGFLYNIEILRKQGLIDNEMTDLYILEDFIIDSMKADIRVGNYDFLHGAIGNVLYLLSRVESNDKAKQSIVFFIEELEKNATIDSNTTLKWLSVFDYTDNSKCYNLSMSHGQASIISILCKIYKKNILAEKTKELIEKSVNFVLSQKIEVVEVSYFPPLIKLNNEPTSPGRLAWCYGDLGVAYSIWVAGETLNNIKWKSFAIEVLMHASDRRNLRKEFVIEAGLCHGTAGIAHIYNRLFNNTGIEKFRETHEFWINETLKMSKIDNRLVGYKAYIENKWTDQPGFLVGIAGIGLSLISSISPENMDWDECLLLS